MATMSRRIPPTPVAAPWNGSTADGWLCDSTLNATASPSPRSITPGVLAGPLQDALARRGQPLQQRRGVLVAAVLGPEQREDRELEVVRLPLEKTPDSLELAVREPERAVQRLFRNLRQRASLPRASDGTVRR